MKSTNRTPSNSRKVSIQANGYKYTVVPTDDCEWAVLDTKDVQVARISYDEFRGIWDLFRGGKTLGTCYKTISALYSAL